MKMIHPEVEAVADVVDAASFNAVWAPRGWELLGEPESFATELLSKPVKKLDELKVDELKLLVAARGLEYPAASAKKADVAQSFLETFEARADEVMAPEATTSASTSSAPADTTKKDK